jgi:hypothetical protein
MARNLNQVQFGISVADDPSEGQPNQYSKQELMGVFAKWTKTVFMPLDEDGGQAGGDD